MVKTCCVYKCNNQYDQKAKSKGLSFFRFPKNKRQRKAWIKAINRKDWTPGEHSWICSAHFIDGWHGYEAGDHNYAPTIFNYKLTPQTTAQKSRETRLEERTVVKEDNAKKFYAKKQEEAFLNTSVSMHCSYTRADTSNADIEACSAEYTDLDMNLNDTNIVLTKDIGVQCDADPLLEENSRLRKENDRLRADLEQQKWGISKIKDNDSKTKFYTGLPSFAVFLWLFNFLKPKAERMRYWVGQDTTTEDRQRSSLNTLSLPLVEQFFAVLLRLKLGLFVRDVSERFAISEGTFSKYFTSWLCLMYEELKQINPFPCREIIDRTMPDCFKQKYPSTRIILDCTEIFVQRASSLINQSMLFSNYKHHTTMKFLVGITPAGVISFVSNGWGGRASDRQITIESGVLDLLDENDSVMADKGFTIKDVVEKKKCTLNIPPFMGGCAQFSTEQVFETQEIARVRIHVERSIGRVKTFHILDGILPLTLAPQATKIFKVCCWLTNLDEPLVK